MFFHKKLSVRYREVTAISHRFTATYNIYVTYSSLQSIIAELLHLENVSLVFKNNYS